MLIQKIQKFNDVVKKEFRSYSTTKEKIGFILVILFVFSPLIVVSFYALITLYCLSVTFVELFNVLLLNGDVQDFYNTLPLTLLFLLFMSIFYLIYAIYKYEKKYLY